MKKTKMKKALRHPAKLKTGLKGRSPTQIICVSFVVVIALGTLLLSVPVAKIGRASCRERVYVLV